MAQKVFEFVLAIFKKGDDLGFFLEENEEDPAAAFEALAQQYAAAAANCMRMAAVLASDEAEGVGIEADGHMISVIGPVELLQPLTEGDDALLSEWPEDDEDDDDDDDDDDSEEEDL